METKWGMSEKDIDALYERDLANGITFKDYLKAGSLATLRHVYEEGEKPLPAWDGKLRWRRNHSIS